MIAILVTIVICTTLIYVIDRLHTNPITFIVHRKFEEIQGPAQEPTPEEKKLIEEQAQVVDGLNEVIKFTQDFLGGEPYAESKRKAE